MFEFRLPGNWSVEADGLYHPLRYDLASVLPNGTLIGVSPSPVITFEFPVLAKYRFRWGKWRPFVEAGPSFRTAGNLNNANPSHYGAALGVGAETSLGEFRIAPEVRYVRWAEDNPFYVQTRSDQVELLLSLSNSGFEKGRVLGSHVSVGVVAGATLTPNFSTVQESFGDFGTVYSSGPRNFLVGPMVEIALPKGLFVELDAIHTPVSSHLQGNFDGGAFSSATTVTTWNLPLLGKYKFKVRGVRPFIEAGPSFRDASAVRWASPHGVTAGVGVETHFRRLKIAPAVRYTYWGPNSPGLDQPYLTFVPIRNQVELLGGFFF